MPDEQQPPYTLLLQVVGAEQQGTIVFLLGFIGSHNAWNNDFLALARQYRLLLPDALGFGRSPKPDIGYTLDDHLHALRATLQLHTVDVVHLVGHSMGGILALAYAQRWPEEVGKLVLLATPFYRSETEARQIVARSSLFNRLFAMDNPLARGVCMLMCATRPLLMQLVPRFVHDGPELVAQDSLHHTWTSYARTLQHVVFETPARLLIREVAHPIRIVQGTKDTIAPLALTREATTGLVLVQLTTLPAEHRFVFTHSGERAALTDQWIRREPKTY
jgi:pimeloyl-ACP methyl ester carboxylesterase